MTKEGSIGIRNSRGKSHRPGEKREQAAYAGRRHRSASFHDKTGANRHDVSQLETQLDSVIIERPDPFEHPQNLCFEGKDLPELEEMLLDLYEMITEEEPLIESHRQGRLLVTV